MQVWFQCFHTEDRVVGITIETSSGRRKELFSYEEARMRRNPVHVKPIAKWLECREGYEVVGFHGIFSVCCPPPASSLPTVPADEF